MGELFDLMLKLAKIRYPYNQGSLGNIYKAEARQHEVQNMMLMISGDIEDNSYRLKTLMSISPETTIMIDTSMRVVYKPNPQLYDTAALSVQRSDVKQLDKYNTDPCS